MVTLTETQVDLADQHTTLFYLGSRPPAAPLPFSTAAKYNKLHDLLATQLGWTYGDVRRGAEGVVLDKLTPAYGDYKYWHRFLDSSQTALYPERAWDDVLPIEATLKCRIACEPGAQFKFDIRPLPRAVIYPFGWSVWVSLRLTGAHTVGDLSALLRAVFTEKVFRLDGAAELISLREFFKFVSAGVRADAFGGELGTKDIEPPEVTLVTTVLAKHGGSLSPAALSPDVEAQLRRIVSPDGPPGGGPFKELLYLYDEGNPLEYMLSDGQGRFVWIEHLLNPVGRNYKHLRCYHHNTFRSLVHARHLCSLITAMAKQKTRTDHAVSLAQAAADALQQRRYRNAGLEVFLAEPGTAKVIQAGSTLKAARAK
jgi:hypothetical protein